MSFELPLGPEDIRNIIDHRWPFLYLDQVTGLKMGESATGIKNVTVSEPHFAGHFPSQSVMPGVLLIETLAQLAGIIVASSYECEFEMCLAGKREEALGGDQVAVFLAGVKRMRFRDPAVPGDQLLLSARKIVESGPVGDFEVKARTSRRAICDGTITLVSIVNGEPGVWVPHDQRDGGGHD